MSRSMGFAVGVIGGASSWFSLSLKGAFALIGMAAYAELGLPMPIKLLALSLCLLFIILNSLGIKEAAKWQEAGLLDAGEAEAIALARQKKAEWLLTDDSTARLFGEALGLEVHGSLGVVLWSVAVGHLDRSGAEAALDRLAHSSLWISARVLAEARAALDELCR